MTKRIKLRTLLIGGFITLFFAVLVGRVYWVQVVEAEFWADKARESWSRSEKLIPTRGTITDRDGNVLAMDAQGYTVAVNPQLINKLGLEDVIVSKLHNVLGKPESEVREIVTSKKENGEFRQQREVRNEGWKIDKEPADRLERFKEELEEQYDVKDVGIYLIKEQKRYYPKDNMASHIIGYEDKSGEAKMGLEAALDEVLRGEEGEIKYEKDGNGVILENGKVEFKPSRDGKNVKLTIDAEIQHYVESAIKEAYNKYQPKSITAIAADPQTMEILGMANLPDFNPNQYGDFKPKDFANHATRALYEPGSTFKIVTLAAAIEEGYFDPNATYQSGSIRVPGSSKPIFDHKRSGWGPISYLEGLKHSSNVAFVKLGYEMLKADKLKDYITRFGFGQKTGIELSENRGNVGFNLSRNIEVATAAFGQGVVQVTGIQQVAAVAAVANGGKLMVPHLVKEIEDPVTNKTEIIESKVVRKVISENTAKLAGDYLEQVVSDGTGKNAYIEGYRIAGKTGTAQKVEGKGYSTDKYVVSFIGYAPVENPKVIVYVVVDEPNDSNLGGGAVAAPVFREIMLQSLRHLGVKASHTDSEKAIEQKEQTVKVPDLTELKLAQAEAELKGRSLSSVVVGKGGTVLQQIPKAGNTVSPTQRIYLITEDRTKLSIPNMSGLSLRDALEICSLLQIRVYTEGQGFVTSQMLAKQNGERVIKLKLSPPDKEMLVAAADEEAGNKEE
ncbi:Stage V sporulation protein D [Paenibacillus plantiphilus]|uniref:Stage V sporulation protein D n=1 Tax=Paenibacillus plantiphilus TaxID=2905650 RepID=A0ABN8GWE2_9BACL|nr:penicillin-binding transpeptidase domain-containing protein [Paenibacillus plantiphilus]CAH1213837.1 Stage V sporulation protein D [Paenibacillus plantiphilus]